MSTVLVFVVVPAAILLGIAALTLAGGDRSRPDRRYRPGRPFDFAPIWFLAAPERVSSARAITSHGPSHGSSQGSSQGSSHGQGELTAGSGAVEPAAGALRIEDTAGKRVLPGPIGGASDRW